MSRAVMFADDRPKQRKRHAEKLTATIEEELPHLDHHSWPVNPQLAYTVRFGIPE